MRTALALARGRRPDLVVLDLTLPGMSGIDVATALRRESPVPIIMLTARVEESDRLLGLEVGADDYMTKPFSPRELVARVRAVLRRAAAPADAETLRVLDLVLDLPRRIVRRGSTPIDLTTTEFQLLAVMARHPGRVFTRAQLLDAVRGDAGEPFDRAIDAHVKNLRRKIEVDARDAALPAHRVRRGIQMHRRMMSRSAPPWWPEGEPWPPRRRWRRPRRFIWRAGFILGPLLFFTVFGAIRLVAWIVGESWPIGVGAPIILGILLFIFAMRRIGRPLGDVVGAADRVAEGDFSVRVRERGSPWVRTLGRAFNSMTERLERQQRQRRDLMADVAHELRTPLAVMQGRLEGMLDGVYPQDPAQVAQILDETRHLGRLVDDLRTLAHSESGTLALQREPTDLAVLLTEAANLFRADADRRRVALAVRAAGELPLLDTDPVRIREVVTNLLANALRYAPDGGSVTIEARTDTASTIAVSVEDDGPGIAAADLPHVFDRFYKARASSGSGLGLAIAQNLVAAHGGTIAARSTPGSTRVHRHASGRLQK